MKWLLLNLWSHHRSDIFFKETLLFILIIETPTITNANQRKLTRYFLISSFYPVPYYGGGGGGRKRRRRNRTFRDKIADIIRIKINTGCKNLILNRSKLRNILAVPDYELLWFQQDGAPTHFHVTARHFLMMHFLPDGHGSLEM